MKNALIGLLVLIFMIQLVNAAEVCVVVDYGDDEPDSKCVDIDEGINGYELMEETGWNIEWKDFGEALGHALCGINGVGGTADDCWKDDKYWNFNIVESGGWFHTNLVFDGGPDCNSHYCAKDGDVIGLAYGSSDVISKPQMFKANITKIYVDGDKLTDKDVRKGKIEEVFPESTVEFKIELENLYDSDTDIEITDISIEGTIEEIDDGDDIEEEIKEFDLKADKKTTKDLEFTIPLEVEAKDRLLRIELKAEDDAGIKYEDEFTYDLEVEKEDHDVRILKTELNKDSYKCGENLLLYFSILNIGSKNEDVELEIVNEDLELDINEELELSNDAFEESSRYEKRFNIWLPDVLGEGSYPITITANYGGEKEIANVNLVINECEEAGEITDIQTGEISEDEEVEAEITEEEMTTIKETVNKNLPLVLTGVLVALVILIILLLLMFRIVKKPKSI